MIPTYIEVHNFGAIPDARIDLQHISLAAVCGPNGAGKSTAFTIAPTFALFGATKNGCGIDDLVRSGSNEMYVVFGFQHRGERYQVIRTRSLKGKGKTTLELQREMTGEWVSESGASIKETDEKIRQLLNLDESIFTASSMILQGRANEFTARRPGERKAVLSQILGLDIYEQLLERTRKRESSTRVELGAAKNTAETLRARLAEQPATEKQLADARLMLAAEEERLSIIVQGIESREAEVARLVRQQDQVTEAINLAEAHSRARTTKIIERSKHRALLAQAESMLASEEQILAKAAEHDQVKEQLAALGIRELRLHELQAARRKGTAALDGAGRQEQELQQRIAYANSIIANRDDLETAVVEYGRMSRILEQQDQLADKWMELKQERDKVVNALNRAYGRMERLRDERERCRKTAAMVSDSGCIDPEIASCLFLKDAKSSMNRIVEIEAEYADMTQSTLIPLEEAHEKLNEQMNALGLDSEAHRKLREDVSLLRPKAQLAAGLPARIELRDNLVEQREQILAKREQVAKSIADLENEIHQIEIELSPKAELQTRLPKLAEWVKPKEQLPVARQVVQTNEGLIVALDNEISVLDEQLANLQVIIDAGKDIEFRLNTARTDLGRQKEAAAAAQAIINRCHSEIGALQSKLDALQADEEQRQELMDDIEQLAGELVQWQTLVTAFGRNGIPAMLIENAVPELERIANDILSQMTSGKNSLHFETQRAAKTTDGMIETLDIIVSDWHGSRLYETYSGGEQLRIDFALRFALAELLATRAGSRVEWLTIDEGLGSQDREHRELILESIKAVANRFEKVIVITHIEEAQAVFDQKILFRRGLDGLSVEVE